MKIGIDCTNVRGGGGETILLHLAREYHPGDFGTASLTVWCNRTIGDKIKDLNPHIEVINVPEFERGPLQRFAWRLFKFPAIARRSVDVLLLPGGLPVVRGIKNVSMSLNLLPFMPDEYKKDGSLSNNLVYMLLRHTNFRSLAKADGAIFLNQNARDVIFGDRNRHQPYAVCPLGVDGRFFVEDRVIRKAEEISETAPLRLLYVSTINGYKHQWNVVEAVANLREAGRWVTVDFVGRSYPHARKRFDHAIQKHGGDQSGSRYLGLVPHSELAELYEKADVFVFASTCENMPNICLEAMAAALPIASSKTEPMFTMMKNCAVFF